MTSVEDYPFSEQYIFKFGTSENMNSFNTSSFSTSHEYLNSQWVSSQGFEQIGDAPLFNPTFMIDQSRLQTMAPQSQQQFQAQQKIHSQYQAQQQQQQQQQQQAQQSEPQLESIFFSNNTQQLEEYPVNENQFLYGADASNIEPHQHIGQQLEVTQLNNIAYPLVDTFTQATIEQVPQLEINDDSIPLLNMGVHPRFQRARYLSEPNITIPQHQRLEVLTAPASTLSLSPESITFSTNGTFDSTLTDPSNNEKEDDGYKRYKVIRGISSGGSATKPPRVETIAKHHYSPVNLKLIEATLEDLCLPRWSQAELNDKRRIIRIERFQVGAQIVAQFSIVGSAQENPKTVSAQPGVDVVEVSCLECYSRPSDDVDEDEEAELSSYSYQQSNYTSDLKRSFYITSVEVIKIVELLIGTEVQDAGERRRERGRIRSNLVPFWSKKPISSRMSSLELRSSPIPSADNTDFRVELATRIMAYEVRKPRGFDKEVRILRWEKLVPALRRALQSYYVEVPDDFNDLIETI